MFAMMDGSLMVELTSVSRICGLLAAHVWKFSLAMWQS
jgi:hypothetical protein